MCVVSFGKLEHGAAVFVSVAVNRFELRRDATQAQGGERGALQKMTKSRTFWAQRVWRRRQRRQSRRYGAPTLAPEMGGIRRRAAAAVGCMRVYRRSVRVESFFD